MSIYTKKGDRGRTGLPGDRRLSKTDAIFELLGNLDFANDWIGLARTGLDQPAYSELANQLTTIQSNLLSIGACIASESPASATILNKLEGETKILETQIDTWDQQLPALRNFILPGGSQTGATMHLCRTAIRQAERSFHRYSHVAALAPVATYLNRLSDFFFQAARFVNFSSGTPEPVWKNRG